MIDPPASVRLLGITHDVVVRHPDADTRLDEYYGYIDHNRSIIVLNERNVGDRQRETLLHELIHGVEIATSIEFEESQVARLARGLFAVLRDNPELVDYLMDRDTP